MPVLDERCHAVYASYAHDSVERDASFAKSIRYRRERLGRGNVGGKKLHTVARAMGYINAYNRSVERKLKLVSEHYNIPFEYFKPKTIKGVEKMLGVWDKETDKPWKMFRSLGAKRYMILTADDELSITVSGLNKENAVPYLIQKYGIKGSFDHFNEKLKIPAKYKTKEGETKSGTGKLKHYYLDEPMSGEVTDYQGQTVKYYSRSGVYLEKDSYNFTIEEDYLNYLKTLRGELI